jgi:hypothetical protein
MKWENGAPTLDGWYWVRVVDIDEYEIVYWKNGEGAAVRNVNAPLRWPQGMWHFGPLCAPAFTRPEAEVSNV